MAATWTGADAGGELPPDPLSRSVSFDSLTRTVWRPCRHRMGESFPKLSLCGSTASRSMALSLECCGSRVNVDRRALSMARRVTLYTFESGIEAIMWRLLLSAARKRTRCKDVIPVVASPHSTVVFATLESRLSVCAYPVTFTARKVTTVEVINRSQRASLPSHKVAVVAISRTREKSERTWIWAAKMMPDTAWKTESELREGYKGGWARR